MKRTLVVFLCAAALLLAQVSTSQITGTVRDASGAVVPGATVIATNEATGITYTQTTTDAGLYAFASLPVGIYTVSIQAKGFKTTKRAGNTLVVNTPLTVDMSLEIG